MPSILQAISWPSPASTSLMFFTLVPTFTEDEDPLIFRSLMTTTESPSLKTLPLASRIAVPSGASAAGSATGDENKLHS